MGELLLFRLGSGLSILLTEKAEDTSGDFAVDGRLVFFAGGARSEEDSIDPTEPRDELAMLRGRRWILGELLLFRLGSGLSTLFTENAEETSGDCTADGYLTFLTGAAAHVPKKEYPINSIKPRDELATLVQSQNKNQAFLIQFLPV